jgi:translation initiation factor IF-3
MKKIDNSKNRINNQITTNSIRIVSGNVENKLYTFKEAITLSLDLELDLVEISENNGISICKLIDYNKFLYTEKQRKKDLEKNLKKVEVKEIRLTPDTDTHDFNFKLKHAVEFIKRGDKVKVILSFVGREINYKERGEIMLLKFADSLSEIGVVENMPTLVGKKMSLQIKPKK